MRQTSVTKSLNLPLADFIANFGRQAWVTEHEPSSWRDTICLILPLVRLAQNHAHLVEVGKSVVFSKEFYKIRKTFLDLNFQKKGQSWPKG